MARMALEPAKANILPKHSPCPLRRHSPGVGGGGRQSSKQHFVLHHMASRSPKGRIRSRPLQRGGRASRATEGRLPLDEGSTSSNSWLHFLFSGPSARGGSHLRRHTFRCSRPFAHFSGLQPMPVRPLFPLEWRGKIQCGASRQANSSKGSRDNGSLGTPEKRGALKGSEMPYEKRCPVGSEVPLRSEVSSLPPSPTRSPLGALTTMSHWRPLASEAACS